MGHDRPNAAKQFTFGRKGGLMPLAAVDRLAELAAADAWLTRRGRHLNVSFMLEIGSVQYLVHIHRGRIESVDNCTGASPRWIFALRAAETDWVEFWKPEPAPGFHDLLAMLKFKRLRIEGDQHPFMANLRYFKDLLALLRPAGAAA
jgi:hypothetical protein